MKHFVLFLLFIFLPTFVSAESSVPGNKSETEITMTTTQLGNYAVFAFGAGGEKRPYVCGCAGGRCDRPCG